VNLLFLSTDISLPIIAIASKQAQSNKTNFCRIIKTLKSYFRTVKYDRNLINLKVIYKIFLTLKHSEKKINLRAEALQKHTAKFQQNVFKILKFKIRLMSVVGFLIFYKIRYF